jgi:hypothetical protein
MPTFGEKHILYSPLKRVNELHESKSLAHDDGDLRMKARQAQSQGAADEACHLQPRLPLHSIWMSEHNFLLHAVNRDADHCAAAQPAHLEHAFLGECQKRRRLQPLEGCLQLFITYSRFRLSST